MTVFYQITSSPSGATIMVYGDVTATVASTSSTYPDLVEYLTSTPPDEVDTATVQSLVSPKGVVNNYIKRVSDRVSFSGNVLLFDGDPLDDALSSAIIRLSKEDSGGDPTKLVKFLENLMNNPSEHSRKQLYSWLEARNFTITQDGHFLAYKGLNSDFTSINSGPGIVNSVEYLDEHLDNSPGNIVEIARSYVNTSSFVGCATGLHAGTYEYASAFSNGALVLVKINPRDVVSVPTDCEAQKLRVCRYEVIESISAEVLDAYWGEDEDDDYALTDEYLDSVLMDEYDDEDYKEDFDSEDDLDEEEEEPPAEESRLRDRLKNLVNFV